MKTNHYPWSGLPEAYMEKVEVPVYISAGDFLDITKEYRLEIFEKSFVDKGILVFNFVLLRVEALTPFKITETETGLTVLEYSAETGFTSSNSEVANLFFKSAEMFADVRKDLIVKALDIAQEQLLAKYDLVEKGFLESLNLGKPKEEEIKREPSIPLSMNASTRRDFEGLMKQANSNALDKITNKETQEDLVDMKQADSESAIQSPVVSATENEKAQQNVNESLNEDPKFGLENTISEKIQNESVVMGVTSDENEKNNKFNDSIKEQKSNGLINEPIVEDIKQISETHSSKNNLKIEYPNKNNLPEASEAIEFKRPVFKMESPSGPKSQQDPAQSASILKRKTLNGPSKT